MELLLTALSAFTDFNTNYHGAGNLMYSLAERMDLNEVSTLIENSKMINNLIDEARYLVYFYNTSTLVTTGGLALGIAFVLLAVAMYYFYYVTDANSGRSNSRLGSEEEYFTGPKYQSSSYDFVNILEELERAFLLYNLETNDVGCRKKIVCEAHLPNAIKMNKIAAAKFVDIMGRMDPKEMKTINSDLNSDLHNLKAAALSGEHSHTCNQYYPSCPNREIQNLAQIS